MFIKISLVWDNLTFIGANLFQHAGFTACTPATPTPPPQIYSLGLGFLVFVFGDVLDYTI